MVMTSGSRFFTSRVRRSVVASDELLTLTLMLGWVFSNSRALAVNQSAASDLNWKKSKVTVPAVLLPQPASPTVNATAHAAVTTRPAIRLKVPALALESGFILDSFLFSFFTASRLHYRSPLLFDCRIGMFLFPVTARPHRTEIKNGYFVMLGKKIDGKDGPIWRFPRFHTGLKARSTRIRLRPAL